MPDENKFQVLEDASYSIHPTCFFCVHSRISQGSIWGTCKILKYDHKKHDNPNGGREASILSYGSCHRFTLNESVIHIAASHGKFLK